MRIFKWILISVAVVVVAVIGLAYVLPREVEVQRSTAIDAPPDTVFALVNSMQQTEKWSPWLERDPDVKLEYSGPETGVGNKLAWSSDNDQVGTGTQVITASEPNARVETALDFGPMGTADAWFDLQEKAGATEITWGFRTDLGMNPVARWMGLGFDTWIGADYEKGLAKLKAVAEAG